MPYRFTFCAILTFYDACKLGYILRDDSREAHDSLTFLDGRKVDKFSLTLFIQILALWLFIFIIFLAPHIWAHEQHVTSSRFGTPFFFIDVQNSVASMSVSFLLHPYRYSIALNVTLEYYVSFFPSMQTYLSTLTHFNLQVREHFAALNSRTNVFTP